MVDADPQFREPGLGVTPVGPSPFFCGSDGADVWVGSAVPESSGIVTRVRASDGKLLGSWVDAIGAQGVLSAMGRIFVVGTSPSGYNLYMIDPTQPPGPVTLLASNLGPDPSGIAFDGSRIWTANLGSVSIVTPGPTLPWPVTTVGGFGTMVGALYDGTDVWVTDYSAGNLLRLDSNGAVQQTVAVGQRPEVAVFDGANIWVPNFLSDTVSVVQASTGTVLATLAVPSELQAHHRRLRRPADSRHPLWELGGLALERRGFHAARNVFDGDGHPADRRVQRRLELLDAFSTARASSRGSSYSYTRSLIVSRVR